MTKSNLERSLFHPTFPHDRGGTQGRYLAAGTDAEARRSTANWLDLYDLLSLLSYTTHDHHLRGAPPTLIKKMHYRLTYK